MGQPGGELPEGFVELVQADLVDAESVDAVDQADLFRLREQQYPPRLTRTCPGRAGVHDDPGSLLERYRDAEVAPYLHLLPGRAGHDELAGHQRPDGLGEHLVRWSGLQEVHDGVNRRQLGDGVRPEQHRTGADQVHHGRDEPFGHGRLARARCGPACVSVSHAVLAPARHVSAADSARSSPRIAAVLRTGVSVTHTLELPNRPRPARPDSAWPSSFAGSACPGGRNRPARSRDTAVVSSAAEIRPSAKVSDSATAGGSDMGTARSGDRYIGRRSVIADRPQGPTLLRVSRYIT